MLKYPLMLHHNKILRKFGTYLDIRWFNGQYLNGWNESYNGAQHVTAI